MQIDQTDLNLLRAMEWGGILAYNSAVKDLKLREEELRQRLTRMQGNSLVRAYRTTIFVPPFLGGDWVWGCTLIQTRKPETVADAIRQKVPFVTEVLLNASLPSDIGPNLSILFYAKDFEEVKRFLAETRNIDYVEVYQISKFSYPLAKAFSSDELTLLRAIAAHPDADLAHLAKAAGQTPAWTEAKLERLVWDPNNPEGVVLVIPEIDWRKCDNFMHVHFLLELSVGTESVISELGKKSFTAVLEGRLFRNKYLQLDADIWGFEQFRQRKDELDGIKGINLSGMLMAEQNSVSTDWVSALIAQNG